MNLDLPLTQKNKRLEESKCSWNVWKERSKEFLIKRKKKGLKRSREKKEDVKERNKEQERGVEEGGQEVEAEVGVKIEGVEDHQARKVDKVVAQIEVEGEEAETVKAQFVKVEVTVGEVRMVAKTDIALFTKVELQVQSKRRVKGVQVLIMKGAEKEEGQEAEAEVGAKIEGVEDHPARKVVLETVEAEATEREVEAGVQTGTERVQKRGNQVLEVAKAVRVGVAVGGEGTDVGVGAPVKAPAQVPVKKGAESGERPVRLNGGVVAGVKREDIQKRKVWTTSIHRLLPVIVSLVTLPLVPALLLALVLLVQVLALILVPALILPTLVIVTERGAVGDGIVVRPPFFTLTINN